jgi:hypothetical protein
MKPLVLLTVCGCLFLFGGCSTNIAKPEAKTAYSNIDNFQKELAIRAQDVMGQADDFKIVVTQVTFPIGTLMHVGSTRPIDYTVCLPPSAPPKFSAPSLFPTYNLSKTLAIDFGLENEAFTKLADFGVNFKDTDQIALSVKDSQLQVLADNDINTILSKPECRKSISTSSAWLVRGYIFGQRNFLLKSENAKTFKGKIVKIASFNIDIGSGNESVSIADESEKAFLQIVSQINLPIPDKAAEGTHDKGVLLGTDIYNKGVLTSTTISDKGVLAGTDVYDKDVRAGTDKASIALPAYQGSVVKSKLTNITIEQPQLVSTSGRVSVQRDRLDLSNKGENIVKALQSASFSIEHNIEPVDSSHMPRIAQVRYFNENDKVLANKALTELKKLYPTAVLVRIGLPAPSGQIEIWLPGVQVPNE